MSKPVVSLIAACDKNRVIGYQNQLPWSIPADLKYFKATTLNKPIVMGRKTFDSIAKALPGRTNIVITRQHNWSAPNVVVVASLEQAISQAAATGAGEVMVVGGAQIYAESIAIADRLYITEVHAEYEGDTWFPEIDTQCWYEAKREDHFSALNDAVGYSFVTYERVTNR